MIKATLKNWIQNEKFLRLYKFQFVAISIILIVVIPSIERDRILWFSPLIDFLIRISNVFGFYLLISILLNFEHWVRKFFYGKVDFRISNLDDVSKAYLTIFIVLGIFGSYMSFNDLFSTLIPSIGSFSKVIAILFSLGAFVPILIKIYVTDK
jgi:hypothetical protein